MTQTRDPKPANPNVAAQNASFPLPYDDKQDFADAQRGFLGTLPDGVVEGRGKRPVWDMRSYAFTQEEEAPHSVNPSLWRQARLNAIHGLFEVVPRVYQVRGLDLANMTLIEGDKGVILIDTMTSVETATAALGLYRQHRGNRPVTGVILTHSHIDHWGGATAIVDPADVIAGRVPVIAPDQFLEEAVAENVTVGPAMLRRGHFQLGHVLVRGPLGHVDNGLGKATPMGSWALMAPNDLILKTGETRTIDGVRFEFQMAPDTEAPAEMHIWMPDFSVLNMAENATHNFHNLLPLRGAQVRNSLDWSGYINEALHMWGDKAQVLIGQHHWPTWGNARVCAHLKIQRDVYKFIHDQTVRLMNLGLTPNEIAETLRLPESIENAWHARGYYGALKHNAKAIYQHYLGWYDGNPATLDPLPPQAGGQKMLEYMGGAEAVLARAREDYNKGNYRWVIEVLNRALFAEPENAEVRDFLAETYEQQGYLCESATWRNAYLNAAQELRNGVPKLRMRSTISYDTAVNLTIPQLFGVLATRLDGLAAQYATLTIAFHFTDLEQDWGLTLENGALTWMKGQSQDPTASLSLRKTALAAVVAGKNTMPESIAEGEITLQGDAAAIDQLSAWFEIPAPVFNVVEPKPDWAL